jgi:Arc/MetJ-type ribon-helix-helix transcriptional regulator
MTFVRRLDRLPLEGIPQNCRFRMPTRWYDGTTEITELIPMNVRLTPKQVRMVREELKTGRFQTVEQVISRALQNLVESGPASEAGPNGAQGEAVRRMVAFVEKNRVRLRGASVKRLIHEGHRL